MFLRPENKQGLSSCLYEFSPGELGFLLSLHFPSPFPRSRERRSGRPRCRHVGDWLSLCSCCPEEAAPSSTLSTARTVVSLRAPPRSAGKQGPAERGAAARAGAEGSLCRRVWMDGLGFLHAPCCPRSGRTPRAERPRGVTEPLAHLPSWLPRLRKWQPQLAVAPPSRSGPLQPARFHSGRGEGSGVRTPEAAPSRPSAQTCPGWHTWPATAPQCVPRVPRALPTGYL